MTALAWAIGICVAVGLFFTSVGVLGLLRFPDVYTRLHADTKATTFGSLFLGLASGLCATEAWLAGEAGAPTAFWIHAAFAVVVLAVTNAVGGHAIARAAWKAGNRPVGVVDQLAEERERRKVEAEAARKAAEEEAAKNAVETEEGAGGVEGEAGKAGEGAAEMGAEQEVEGLEEGLGEQVEEGAEKVVEEEEEGAGEESPEKPERPEVPEMPEMPENPGEEERAVPRAIKWAVVDSEGGEG